MERRVSAASGGVATPLHLDSGPSGPTIRRRQLRSLTIWAVAALIGLLPWVFGMSDRWRSAGLGLWFPGAGFVYNGFWWATLLMLALFVASIVAWVGVGGFIFPVGVWLLGIALPAITVPSDPWKPAVYVVPAIAAVAIGGFVLARLRRRAKARADGVRIAERLQSVPYTEPPLKVAVAGELSEKELAHARLLMDRVLQPIDSFEGFTTIDQFRESAWRYQLVSTNYALAAMQVNHVPAFSGYLHEAQQNSIIKMTDRRVWHYWRIENFLGNLKFGADPIKSENIMYSGWWALALGAFERATGDLRFSEPGALT